MLKLLLACFQRRKAPLIFLHMLMGEGGRTIRVKEVKCSHISCMGADPLKETIRSCGECFILSLSLSPFFSLSLSFFLFPLPLLILLLPFFSLSPISLCQSLSLWSITFTFVYLTFSHTSITGNLAYTISGQEGVAVGARANSCTLRNRKIHSGCTSHNSKLNLPHHHDCFHC